MMYLQFVWALVLMHRPLLSIHQVQDSTTLQALQVQDGWQQPSPAKVMGLYLSWCPGEGETTDVSGNEVGVVMGYSNGTGVTVDNTLVIKL